MDTVFVKIIVPTPQGKEITLEVECESKFELGTFAKKIHLPEQYFYFYGDKMQWTDYDVRKRWIFGE